MTMAQTVRRYLERNAVAYELIPHEYTSDSAHSAETAHVSGNQLAKSVVLQDQHGFVLAVLPATHHLELDQLHQRLDRRLDFADENAFAEVFNDCEVGAVPPLGQAYGLDVVVDDCISGYTDVYFEAGDHTELVHISGQDFRRLMAGAAHGHFSHHITPDGPKH